MTAAIPFPNSQLSYDSCTLSTSDWMSSSSRESAELFVQEKRVAGEYALPFTSQQLAIHDRNDQS